ncbi:MAG: hypothetical protein COW84_05090 [Gammaproteobacteria bacterium CG22_combo_CG10-13_8_21_14_all_40_8]|nr:MAG: hypothetical protein COW84_05090 [Gammaproteobacteria bacterium CG22_combo_CG10-13_8_21_14_all_40_8]
MTLFGVLDKDIKGTLYEQCFSFIFFSSAKPKSSAKNLKFFIHSNIIFTGTGIVEDESLFWLLRPIGNHAL